MSANTTLAPALVDRYAVKIRAELWEDDIKRFSVSIAGRKLRATHNGHAIEVTLPNNPAREEAIERYGRIVGKGLLALWEAHTEE